MKKSENSNVTTKPKKSSIQTEATYDFLLKKILLTRICKLLYN